MLCAVSGKSPAELGAMLTMMEIRGIVEKLPGNYYICK